MYESYARRGVLQVGEKIQFTDRKGKRITAQLTKGGVTQTEHGIILHDDVIGKTQGVVAQNVILSVAISSLTHLKNQTSHGWQPAQ